MYFNNLIEGLSQDKPSEYFYKLMEQNLLEISHPEIYEMFNYEQGRRHHSEGCVGKHTLRVLDEAAILTTDVKSRYGALYHDIGKVRSWKTNENFYDHKKESVIRTELDILEGQGHNSEFLNIAFYAALNHHFIHEFLTCKPGTILKKMTSDKFPENEEDLERLLIASRSDVTGRINYLGDTDRHLSEEEKDYLFQNREEVLYDGFKHAKFETSELDTYVLVRKIFKEVILSDIEVTEDKRENIDYINHQKINMIKEILS